MPTRTSWPWPNRSARLRCAPLPPGPRDMVDVLFGLSDPVALESAAPGGSGGRWHVYAAEPLAIMELREGQLRDATGRGIGESGMEGFWSAMREAFDCASLCGAIPPEGYLPGWLGFIGYDTGRMVERLPGRAIRDTALPDLRLGFYDAIVLVESRTGEAELRDLVFDTPPPGAGRGAEALRAAWNAAPPMEASPSPIAPETSATPWDSNFTPDAYCKAVARCIEYIAAGDIFQVNLSQRFATHTPARPEDIYRALRRRNPASHSAFLSFSSGEKHCAVLSSSPELFLRSDGSWVETQPIKGTRPRIGHADADARSARDLQESAKDQAELTMIIDLLRNDLGRVCRYGTIGVHDRARLETHPTVFHLVGTVRGKLADGVGPAELLRATFPGGSITGAPKVRAMEIIDELEAPARGVYTGSIGAVGVDGRCEWSIAIRTMLWQDGWLTASAGGGIVADSTPEGEYEETLAKARALFEAEALSRSVAQDEGPT